MGRAQGRKGSSRCGNTVNPRRSRVGGWERMHSSQLITRDGDNTDHKANKGEDIVIYFIFPPWPSPFYTQVARDRFHELGR
jgi:hypothetical protein